MSDLDLEHAYHRLEKANNMIDHLAGQLAEAQGVIERQAKVLRVIEEMLLPAEQTGWLSGSGREIMRMVRAALSPPQEQKP